MARKKYEPPASQDVADAKIAADMAAGLPSTLAKAAAETPEAHAPIAKTLNAIAGCRRVYSAEDVAEGFIELAEQLREDELLDPDETGG